MKDLLIPIIAFVIVADIVLFAVIIKYRAKSGNKFLDLFERLAQKHNGRVVKRFYNLIYSLEVPCDGVKINISFTSGGKNSPPRTQFSAKLNFKCKGLVITGENALTRFGKKFGFKDIQLNNSSFDDAFLVQGKDSYFIRTLLDYEVQEALLKNKEQKPYLYIRKTQFSLSVPKVLQEEQEYDDLIDLSSKLIRKLSQTAIH